MQLFVAYYHPGYGEGTSGDLETRTITSDENVDFIGHHRPIVAIFAQRSNGQGGFFTDEFSGWEVLGAGRTREGSTEGFNVKTLDTGGTDDGRVKPFFNDDTTDTIRAVDKNLVVAYVGSTNLDVYNKGVGTTYENLLDEARDLLPTS